MCFARNCQHGVLGGGSHSQREYNQLNQCETINFIAAIRLAISALLNHKMQIASEYVDLGHINALFTC
jgi:hypothetical protein